MAVLNPTEFYGTVTWIGRVADRDAALASTEVTTVALGFAGIPGESHGGLTRPACSRVSQQYKQGTEIRNVRQLSVLSVEELDATAQALGIPHIAPAWTGASLVLEGIPDFTLVPPSSRLVFDSGLSLVVDMENAPCHLTAKSIGVHHPEAEKGYRKAATHRRGVTAWVEAPGTLSLGARARLHTPPNRLYPHLAAV
ncbi:MAG: sulfurase [Pseudomonadota bacterium]